MESKRQHKYGRQIQKDLGEIFQRDVRHFFGNSLVSVTGVTVAPDLSLARVYFSVYPISDADQILKNLNNKKSEIRKLLGNRIAKQVRKIPELAFFMDNTEEEASHLDKLIDGLNIPPEKD